MKVFKLIASSLVLTLVIATIVQANSVSKSSGSSTDQGSLTMGNGANSGGPQSTTVMMNGRPYMCVQFFGDCTSQGNGRNKDGSTISAGLTDKNGAAADVLNNVADIAGEALFKTGAGLYILGKDGANGGGTTGANSQLGSNGNGDGVMLKCYVQYSTIQSRNQG